MVKGRWIGASAVVAMLLWSQGCSSGSETRSRSAYCPGEQPSATGLECRTHAECGAGSECALPDAVASTGLPLIGPGAPQPPPCSLIPCATDVECSTGEVCDDPSRATTWSGDCYQSLYCVPACSCIEGERCRPDGHCEVIPCDAPDAPACPTGTVCVPGGSDPGAPDSTAAAAGCVRVPCDMPGGVVCDPGFACDPANAPNLGPYPPWGNTAGCAPIACDAGWDCAAGLVCYPGGIDSVLGPATGSFATREDGRQVDVHGCVQPNCLEGLICPTYRTCDLEHPTADADGCRVMTCDEPDGPDCMTLYSGLRTCDPAGASPDAFGCVERPCAAAPDGCAVDAGAASGGTTATGGSGGTAGGGDGGNEATPPTTDAGAAVPSTGVQGAGGAPQAAPCAIDADCACGSCVLSVCAPRPGTCRPR